jgi:hypothetical protein
MTDRSNLPSPASVADYSWFGAGPICAQNLALRRDGRARRVGGARRRLAAGDAVHTGKTGYNVSGYFNSTTPASSA